MRSATVPKVELLGIADVARELKTSTQAVWNWVEREKMPPPDFWHGRNKRPLWKRSTLVKADILK